MTEVRPYCHHCHCWQKSHVLSLEQQVRRGHFLSLKPTVEHRWPHLHCVYDLERQQLVWLAKISLLHCQTLSWLFCDAMEWCLRSLFLVSTTIEYLSWSMLATLMFSICMCHLNSASDTQHATIMRATVAINRCHQSLSDTDHGFLWGLREDAWAPQWRCSCSSEKNPQRLCLPLLNGDASR